MEREGASFDWDATNIRHLTRHGVTPNEAEQAVLDPDAIMVQVQEHGNEQRLKSVGITATGRLLAVIFALRGQAIRPITAYDAPQRLKKLYFERR